MESNEKIEFESLIDDIESTKQCGICGSKDNPIDCNSNNSNVNEINWIACDGPREDDSNSILCNQWYHQECIDDKYKNNQFFNDEELDIFFGHNCQHSDWYRNLNKTTQKLVVKNIKDIRNKSN